MGIAPDVTVNHGSNSKKVALSGETVDEAIDAIVDELGWNVSDLDWTLNGERSSDLPEGGDTRLRAGDTITFLARAGNKGVIEGILVLLGF